MAWIGRGSISKYLPKPIADFFHNLQYNPAKPHLMEPGPKANQTFEGVPRIKGYRNPAPGSRPPPVIPLVEDPDMIFDTKFYSRDTTHHERERLLIVSKKFLDPDVLATLEEGAKPKPVQWEGSDGQFGNPAVLEYDPTGLRSAMTATHKALDEALDAREPTQLPTYAWEPDTDAIVAFAKANDIPIPPGAPMKWKVPKRAKIASW